jgi:predicted dithiol-disulfide oxidoreductase (DUF899 family)
MPNKAAAKKQTSESQIPHPAIVSQAEWRSVRLAHLEHEKEMTKQLDNLRAERRRLPMVKIDKNYVFEGPQGKRSLRDLFGECRQLIVYHFMFDPAWDKGCPGCTSFVDALGDLSMLGKRDTRFVLISRAPLAKLDAYKSSRSWNLPWCSSFGSDFNYDFHVSLDPDVAPLEYNYKTKSMTGGDLGKGEGHGLSVFFRLGDELFHTYSTYGRGTENLTNSYELLDVTPYGRQEDFEESPKGWPQKPTYGNRE